MIKQFSSNLAFLDIVFNLLLTFIALFILAFLLINPPKKTGAVEPPVKMMIESTWDSASKTDIDLYLMLPNSSVVYYANKDSAPAILERDDLGITNDTYSTETGTIIEVQRNYEVITVSDLPDGDYVIAVHYFGGDVNPSETVEVLVRTMKPYSEVVRRKVDLTHREEKYIASLNIRDGAIVDVDYTNPIRIRKNNIRADE